MNAVNDGGETPIHAMIRYNHFNQVELLLQQGANVNTQDKDSNSPLHNAAWHGEDGIELARLLISNGADTTPVMEEAGHRLMLFSNMKEAPRWMNSS